jgi:CRISPR-associated protein Cas5d
MGPRDADGKHLAIMTQRLRRGRHHHQPVLGCREFPAHVELLSSDQPPVSAALTGERDLGLMLHSIWGSDGKRNRGLFRAVMRDGIIEIPRDPEYVERYIDEVA